MTTATAISRLSDQLTAGTWSFDPNHTIIGFAARHLMVTKVRGRFTKFDGSVEVGPAITDSKVTVEIDAASITTGAPDRDAHMNSADFFNVAEYPTLRFVSTDIRADGDDWLMTGDLTIKDVTRPVTLDVEFEGTETNPWGKSVAAFSATTEIDREDWGMTWNASLESGGVLVSKKIKIEIEAQLVNS